MPGPPASQESLLPRPRRLRTHPGTFRLRHGTRIICKDSGSDTVAHAARLLRDQAVRDGRLRWTLRRADHPPSRGTVTLEQVAPTGRRPHEDQWYTLRIRPGEVRLRAAGAAGLRYAVLTLGQLIAARRGAIRAMDIEDWPDFGARGVMLDISRDKVPTLSTLRRLIDLLAGWKINQLQLYTEHTFAYSGHKRVWRGASPMTGSQIDRLDHECRRRGIELVPNQNSFGHMERWLKHKPYAKLAETSGQWQTPWGEPRTLPATLNPLHPGSIRLMTSLYDQLLPRFSSRLFNVGCDETWELGQGRSREACRRRGVGRVYLDFLLKLRRAVRKHGRKMLFWSDVAQLHPELIGDLPRDVVPIIWGYEANHPFDEQCRRLRDAGLEFYVCGGTSSWCSFGGRSSNCVASLRRGAAAGNRHGAVGFLIADWGDYGHRQYLPASYCGFLYGAAVGWCGKSNAKVNVARELSRHVFDDPSGASGRLWFDLGTVHEASPVNLKNRTVLFACMHTALRDLPAIDGLTAGNVKKMECRVVQLQERAKTARFGGPDADLVRQELLATLIVLRHACRRAALSFAPPSRVRRACRFLAADMVRIIDTHRALWLARNRRGGLAASLDHYRRNLREYRTTLSKAKNGH